MNNFKKTRGYPYILYYEMEVTSLFNMWLVPGCDKKLFELYFCWTRERLSDRDNKSAVGYNDFDIRNIPKMVFMVPFTMQVQVRYKCVCFSVCKGEFYGNLWRNILSFFSRKILISAFLLRLKANYLEKMQGYLNFSLWIPIAPVKICYLLDGTYIRVFVIHY